MYSKRFGVKSEFLFRVQKVEKLSEVTQNTLQIISKCCYQLQKIVVKKQKQISTCDKGKYLPIWFKKRFHSASIGIV